MKLNGCININNRAYGVVECEYEFAQSVDDTGKPTTRTKGGLIKFVMPATSDDDQFFYKWMFNKTQVYSGEFRFRIFSNENLVSQKTIKFTKAYCIALKDYFNYNDENNRLMYTTVTISAEKIQIGAGDPASFTNEWT